ncbi:hypothetical protein AS4_05940 [Acinetobacter guillouiae]|jgi:hypothetical protein|nr:hypothetical protein AS4_05940 [Acinetobacter guillouiae]
MLASLAMDTDQTIPEYSLRRQIYPKVQPQNSRYAIVLIVNDNNL